MTRSFCAVCFLIIFCLLHHTNQAQGIGTLKNALKNNVKREKEKTSEKKEDNKKPVEQTSSNESKQESSETKTTSSAQDKKDETGSDVFYPGKSGGPFSHVKINGIGTGTVNLKQFSDGNKEPDIDVNLTKLADDVYNSNNIMEKPDSKLIVVHPDGSLTLLKVSKELSYWNWTFPLTKDAMLNKIMPEEEYKTKLNYAQDRVKDAYEKSKGNLAKERSARLSPLVKQIKAADTDAEGLKLCAEAHNKLFNGPKFSIKDLTYVKAMSARSDWKIVRDQLNNIQYRIKDYVVIAKNNKTGQCYVMYNSITQEYAGTWQTVRCSTYDEGGGYYLLSDKEELKWGQAYEIECF
jgi:hypothetical protein